MFSLKNMAVDHLSENQQLIEKKLVKVNQKILIFKFPAPIYLIEEKNVVKHVIDFQ